MSREILVAVVGAHLDGEPLNHELLAAGATLAARTATADHYRLWALPDGRRPALERRPGGGASIEVETWSVPSAEFGPFVARISPPLAIGVVDLIDGTHCCGFVCETGGLEGATEITEHGGWRAWRASRPE